MGAQIGLPAVQADAHALAFPAGRLSLEGRQSCQTGVESGDGSGVSLQTIPPSLSLTSGLVSIGYRARSSRGISFAYQDLMWKGVYLGSCCLYLPLQALRHGKQVLHLALHRGMVKVVHSRGRGIRDSPRGRPSPIHALRHRRLIIPCKRAGDQWGGRYKI